MKTIKLALVIAILGFASMVYADVEPGSVCFRIPLKKAIQNQKLVRAMYEQLDMSFINVDQNGLYVARVLFNRNIYFIFGTYEEWLVFFTMDITDGRENQNSGDHLLIRAKR
jgi:hypothetical protein